MLIEILKRTVVHGCHGEERIFEAAEHLTAHTSIAARYGASAFDPITWPRNKKRGT